MFHFMHKPYINNVQVQVLTVMSKCKVDVKESTILVARPELGLFG